MTTEILVNIGSGNGSLPDGTDPLPGPKLTNHQLGLVAFTWGNFTGNDQDIYQDIYLCRHMVSLGHNE